MSHEPLVFFTESSYVLRIGFGAFVFLVTLVPSCIVAYQWLWSGEPPSTSPGSLIPAGAIMVWAIWGMTHWMRVTVDPASESIVWEAYGFGLRWWTVKRLRSEIECIETTKIRGINFWYYEFVVRGSGHRRVLFSGTKNSGPWVVRETSRRLGIPLEPWKEED